MILTKDALRILIQLLIKKGVISKKEIKEKLDKLGGWKVAD